MGKAQKGHVTIRIRVGPQEFEVTGPRAWAEKQLAKFLRRVRAEAASKKDRD